MIYSSDLKCLQVNLVSNTLVTVHSIGVINLDLFSSVIVPSTSFNVRVGWIYMWLFYHFIIFIHLSEVKCSHITLLVICEQSYQTQLRRQLILLFYFCVILTLKRCIENMIAIT